MDVRYYNTWAQVLTFEPFCTDILNARKLIYENDVDLLLCLGNSF